MDHPNRRPHTQPQANVEWFDFDKLDPLPTRTQYETLGEVLAEILEWSWDRRTKGRWRSATLRMAVAAWVIKPSVYDHATQEQMARLLGVTDRAFRFWARDFCRRFGVRGPLMDPRKGRRAVG